MRYLFFSKIDLDAIAAVIRADEVDLNEDFVITFDTGNEEAGNDWYFDDISGPILKK